MSTITKQWLQQKIADMEAARDEIPLGLDEDDSNTLAALRIALASLEAEAVAWRYRFVHTPKSEEHGSPFTTDWVLAHNEDECNPSDCFERQPLYTAPPAPVSVPECFKRLLHHAYGMTMGHDWNKGTMAGHHRDKLCQAVDECRAAMLQGAEPVTTAYKLTDEIGSSLQLRNLIRQRHAEWSQATFGDVGPVGPLKHLSKEALEAAAEPNDLSEWADMQFLLWDAQRRAGICDGEITAAMEEKLKVNMARQWPEPKDGEPRLHIKADGNSPVIPDDVLRMDWLVSKTVDVREPMVYGSHSLFWSQTITDEEDDYHATKLREQIDAAMAVEQAAAPQQEAKNV